jgi:hypothetical protein
MCRVTFTKLISPLKKQEGVLIPYKVEFKPYKVEFKPKLVRRNKEGHFIVIKEQYFKKK